MALDGAVVRGVADMEKCRRHFGDRGLKREASGGSRRLSRRRTARGLRPRAAEGLPKASGSTACEIVRGATAERAEEELSLDCDATRDGAFRSTYDPGIAFLRRKRIGGQRQPSLAKPGRANARATCRAVPARVGRCAAPDIRKMEEIRAGRRPEP